jgi:hypothetical protein
MVYYPLPLIRMPRQPRREPAGAFFRQAGGRIGVKPADWRRRMLRWRGRQLYRPGSDVPVAEIVPDAKWPGMWRVRTADGRLSDMVNLTRARDAAMELAVAVLNRQDSAGHGVGASPMRVPIAPAPETHPAMADALSVEAAV